MLLRTLQQHKDQSPWPAPKLFVVSTNRSILPFPTQPSLTSYPRAPAHPQQSSVQSLISSGGHFLRRTPFGTQNSKDTIFVFEVKATSHFMAKKFLSHIISQAPGARFWPGPLWSITNSPCPQEQQQAVKPRGEQEWAQSRSRKHGREGHSEAGKGLSCFMSWYSTVCVSKSWLVLQKTNFLF